MVILVFRKYTYTSFLGSLAFEEAGKIFRRPTIGNNN